MAPWDLQKAFEQAFIAILKTVAGWGQDLYNLIVKSIIKLFVSYPVPSGDFSNIFGSDPNLPNTGMGKMWEQLFLLSELFAIFAILFATAGFVVLLASKSLPISPTENSGGWEYLKTILIAGFFTKIMFYVMYGLNTFTQTLIGTGSFSSQTVSMGITKGSAAIIAIAVYFSQIGTLLVIVMLWILIHMTILTITVSYPFIRSLKMFQIPNVTGKIERYTSNLFSIYVTLLLAPIFAAIIARIGFAISSFADALATALLGGVGGLVGSVVQAFVMAMIPIAVGVIPIYMIKHDIASEMMGSVSIEGTEIDLTDESSTASQVVQQVDESLEERGITNRNVQERWMEEARERAGEDATRRDLARGFIGAAQDDKELAQQKIDDAQSELDYQTSQFERGFTGEQSRRRSGEFGQKSEEYVELENEFENVRQQIEQIQPNKDKYASKVSEYSMVMEELQNTETQDELADWVSKYEDKDYVDEDAFDIEDVDPATIEEAHESFGSDIEDELEEAEEELEKRVEQEEELREKQEELLQQMEEAQSEGGAGYVYGQKASEYTLELSHIKENPNGFADKVLSDASDEALETIFETDEELQQAQENFIRGLRQEQARNREGDFTEGGIEHKSAEEISEFIESLDSKSETALDFLTGKTAKRMMEDARDNAYKNRIEDLRDEAKDEQKYGGRFEADNRS